MSIDKGKRGVYEQWAEGEWRDEKSSETGLDDLPEDLAPRRPRPHVEQVRQYLKE